MVLHKYTLTYPYQPTTTRIYKIYVPVLGLFDIRSHYIFIKILFTYKGCCSCLFSLSLDYQTRPVE